MGSLSLRRLFSQPAVREPLRHQLQGILAWALRCRSRPYEPGSGPVMVVAPHPDDGPLGCGGFIFRCRLDGVAVHAVCLTDGAASHPGHPHLTGPELVRRRRLEEEQAGASLGLDGADLHFCGLPDGELARLTPAQRQEAVDTLVRLLLEVRPAEVLLPCRRDGSSEHEAAFALVGTALARAQIGCRLLEYPVWAWWNPLRLGGPLARARRVWRVDFAGYESVKRRAIAAYETQIAPVPPWSQPVLAPEFVAALARDEEFLFEMETPCAGS